MEKSINGLNIFKIVYMALPFILWYLTFIVLSSYFWLSMFASVTMLGVSTIVFFGKNLGCETDDFKILLGFVVSLFLYTLFYVGNIATSILGMSSQVSYVYQLVGTAPNKLVLAVELIWIGTMEEIFWRGGVQEKIFREIFAGKRWFFSSILYAFVHVVTFNFVLVVAAFLVGVIMGITAQKYGLASAITAHTVWLLLIIVVAPVA